MTNPNRPDKLGIALLQARHVLNEAEQDMRDQSNFKEMLVSSDEVVIKMHVMAWGLFKTTLLKAMKDREDLKKWSPELFSDDKVCHHCSGNGRIDIPKDHETYLEHVKDSEETEKRIANKEIERGPLDIPFKHGDPLYWHCTPCQGSGILTLLDQQRK